MIHLGLLGYPLGHSLSPIIQTAALGHCGLKGEYSLFSIHPDDQLELEKILYQVRDGKITGLNVTIPYKRKVIPLVDDLSQAAEEIGAVNTLYVADGLLMGDNTDAPGFMADLDKFLSTMDEKQNTDKYALVLGAGGAARSVVYALSHSGWRVCIAARRPEQAQSVIGQFQNRHSQLKAIKINSKEIGIVTKEVSLIVNATPVGMYPDDNVSPWPSGLTLPVSAAVYDLIYNPSETRFIKDAHAAGLDAISGIGMLVEQAALAFERWTGCVVSRDVMYKALEEK